MWRHDGVQVGKDNGVPEYGWIVALATAMQVRRHRLLPPPPSSTFPRYHPLRQETIYSPVCATSCGRK